MLIQKHIHNLGTLMPKLNKYTFIYEPTFSEGHEIKKVIWAKTERAAYIKFRTFYIDRNISIEKLRVES